MKARIPNNELELTPDKLAVMKLSLELLIESSGIEGISYERKISQDCLAKATLEKLINEEERFNLEEMRIISCALLFFKIVIEKPEMKSDEDNDFKKDSLRYLAIIDELRNFYDRQFRAAGFDVGAL